MSYQMLLNESDATLEILQRRPALKIKNGEAGHTVAETALPHGAFEVVIDGKRFTGFRYTMGDEVHVKLGGRSFVVGLPQAQLRAHSHSKMDDEIRAEMPGTMISVNCEAGQTVAAGDKLVTIESMKLQLTLVAPRDGVIEKVHVPAETAFERGALLVSFVAAAQGESKAEAAPEAAKA